MSVEITFQPANLSGLIAEGTYLIDAAKRMGLRLPADCHERGECTACVVSVVSGQSLLSPPTRAERKMLAEEGLAKELRLACQARIERTGELVVLIPEASREKRAAKEASALPFDNKFAREVQRIYKTFDDFLDKSRLAGENLLDRFERKARSTRERELQRKRPPEHRQRKNG